MTNLVRLLLCASVAGLAAWGQGAGDRFIFGFSGGGAGVTSLTIMTGSGGQTLDFFDRGWYRDDTFHLTTNDNYIAGICCGNRLHRDFFVFDLPGETILSAELNVSMPINGYFSPFDAETFSLRDITTDLTALVNGTGGLAAFNDLADGVVYGSTIISAASQGTVVNIPLNAAALLVMNSLGGGLFGIGGSIGAVGLDQGTVPGDPLLPLPPPPGDPFVFIDPPPRRWFDPPFASAFEYEITGGFFTEVGLDLIYPGASVEVLVGTTPGGPMFANPDPLAGTSGDAVADFIFSFTTGDVTKFRITGISVDLDDDGVPGWDLDAFPTFLDFSAGAPTTITMTPILADGPEVPEPGTYLMVAAGLALALPLGRRLRGSVR